MRFVTAGSRVDVRTHPHSASRLCFKRRREEGGSEAIAIGGENARRGGVRSHPATSFPMAENGPPLPVHRNDQAASSTNYITSRPQVSQTRQHIPTSTQPLIDKPILPGAEVGYLPNACYFKSHDHEFVLGSFPHSGHDPRRSYISPQADSALPMNARLGCCDS
ncbi:hypothetical protein BT67DRAFT_12595 [Trichocladium antarcticum]|uniref:Uncharacterized protein n=1 Tax=Trichocladium antarcticum TaxID=1450529 RepID=A0AAN6ZHE9_9PEZI|nr:hypothetical protein BT67DRAFT_12595 [Trichocladium antarcticum]